MAHEAEETRYSSMRYNRCGRSGLKLPAISLGLWHNFGGVDPSKVAQLEDAVGAVNNLSLSAEELQTIEGILQ